MFDRLNFRGVLSTAAKTNGTNFPRRRLNLGDDDLTIYAVGDIHGCYKELLVAESKIVDDINLHDHESPVIIYLGDYVDRGPDSNLVISHLAQRDHRDGLRRVAVCGNHDAWFLEFLRNPAENFAWLGAGGNATLQSYGVRELHNPSRRAEISNLQDALNHAVPAEHVEFLSDLPVLAMYREYLFVHAGISPRIAIDNQRDADMMWIREPFLSRGPGLPSIVIHGHTVDIEPVVGPNRICIDTGCYATGRLTVMKIERGVGSFLD